jgi:hypothetical protein
MMKTSAATPRYAVELWDRSPHWGCPVCGLEYVKELESDRRLHRTHHRKVLAVFEPQPMPTLIASYAAHGQFVPVDMFTPRPVRQRLEKMAYFFRRELHFDFPPYSADECDVFREPAHHWLIVSPDGRPIGGLSVRWRIYSDAPPNWVWAWAWVIPSERRRGYVRRCWEFLKPRSPDIEPELPLSYPVAKFFAERSDVPEHVRNHAAKEAALEPEAA